MSNASEQLICHFFKINHNEMKQKIYFLGLAFMMMVFIGSIFKIQHWPLAGIILTIGLFLTAFVFVPLALLNYYRSEENGKKNLLLHIVTWLTCVIVFTAMLFKLMHWPFAGLLLTIALPFPYIVFLPVYLSSISSNKNHNIYKTVAVLFLLVVSSVLNGLLALNVSKSKIYDSLNFSDHYNRVEAVLDMQSVGRSAVTARIDETLSVIDEYQELILKADGITEAQWSLDPHSLNDPFSRKAIENGLSGNPELSGGKKLENELKNLISLLNDTPGYEDLARSLPLILDLGPANGEVTSYIRVAFSGSIQSWTLIWLDAMETNLKLIRATM